MCSQSHTPGFPFKDGKLYIFTPAAVMLIRMARAERRHQGTRQNNLAGFHSRIPSCLPLSENPKGHCQS